MEGERQPSRRAGARGGCNLIVRKEVQGASQTRIALIGVQVDHGGPEALVAHQLLDRSDVSAGSEHVGCKRVSERVARDGLGIPVRRAAVLTARCKVVGWR